MKPIRLSGQARIRALQRGATEEEIVECVRESVRMPASAGRFSIRETFAFDAISPMNKEYYRFKTIEPIFVEAADEIVLVAVKVYFSNEESGL